MLRSSIPWVWIIACVSSSAQAAPVVGRVKAQAVEPVPPGERGELSLTVLDTPERTLPLEVRVEAETVHIPDNRLSWADVVDAEAVQPRLRVAYVAPSADGDYWVSAQVSYVVCGSASCAQRRADVTWLVRVTSSAQR